MKKTLLVALASLAIGTISSQAQAVYSQNIVGYVNTTLAGSSAFTCITAPLSGATNTVEGLMPCLTSGDTVYIWDPAGNAYYFSTYYGMDLGGPPNDWYDMYGNVTNSPTVLPGQGFFYSTQSGNQETNTFTGSVVLSNSIALLGSSAFTCVGSTAPIGGSLESTNFNLPLASGDVIYIWQPLANAYYYSTYYGSDLGGPPNDWYDMYGNVTNAPTVGVGQAFFYSTQSGNAETWNQNLLIQ